MGKVKGLYDKCYVCKGSGFLNERDCPHCKGTGQVRKMGIKRTFKPTKL